VRHRYYAHSGSFEPAGLLLMLAYGLAGAVGGAFIYGYASHYLPLVIVTLLLTVGFGVVTGALVGVGAKKGKVRNTPILLLFSLFVGLSAVYVEWVVFLHLKLDTGAWITEPSEMLRWMQVMAAMGIWEVFGWTPSGGALYAIWGAEATIIAGGALLMPWASLDDLPFCERTGAWAEATEGTGPLGLPPDLDALRSEIEADPAGAIAGLPRLEELEDRFLRAIVHYVADKPNSSYFLSLELVTISYDDEGNLDESTETVVPALVIDRAIADAVCDDG